MPSKKWKEFKICELFEIKKVKGLPIENYKLGDMPYITTAALNNGLSDFISSDKEAISPKNGISVDPIKGKSFYQSYDFVGRGFSGASISVLYSDNLNENIALFFCAAIENTAKYKASYGYLFNGNRLKNAIVLLPVTSQGEPDYAYMDRYVENIMLKQYEAYLKYVQ